MRRRYYFLSERNKKERDLNPKKFDDAAASVEKINDERDTDGSYAKLIQDCKEAAGGDETMAENLFLERIADLVAKRLCQEEEKEEEEEEEEEQQRRLTERKKTKNQKKNQKKKGPGRVDFSALGLDPPPRGFGEKIMERNHGVRDVKLVIMKQLFQTDLSDQHNRFSIPEGQVIDKDFLRAAERECLNTKIDGKTCPGISVKLIGPTEDQSTEMLLKKWELQKTNSYVLNKGWMSLVRRNPDIFKKNAIVQLWSFRTRDGELWFQISKIMQVEEEKEEEEEEASGSRRGNNINQSAGGSGSGGRSSTEESKGGSGTKSSENSNQGGGSGSAGTGDESPLSDGSTNSSAVADRRHERVQK